MLRYAFVVLLLAFSGTSYSQDEYTNDTRNYLDTVQTLRDQSVEVQVEGWRKFLKEHPDSKYREEIELNVRNMEDLVTNTDPSQLKEKKDTDRYFRAVEYSKKLSPQDQLLMWEQYLEENPHSIYRREARKKMDELRSQGLGPNSPLPPSKTTPKQSNTQEMRVAPDLQYKDKQMAVLLATFPGLIVPGIAHWYTKDYATAGILTAMRVGGLAMGIPAMINQNRTLSIVGILLVGFSYIVDIVDAPFTVERYNEGLEKKMGSVFEPNRYELFASLSF